MSLNAHKMLLIYEKSRILFSKNIITYACYHDLKGLKCMILMHEIVCYHSPIIRFNHKFIIIMVNKGQINEEIRIFKMFLKFDHQTKN